MAIAQHDFHTPEVDIRAQHSLLTSPLHQREMHSGHQATQHAPEVPERLLIVSDAWHPQINGVVRSYEHIIPHLERMGCAVKVIGPADFPTLPLPGYSAIPLAVTPYRKLATLIGAFAPQALHIAVEGPLGWAARRYCLRRGLQFSTAFHTNFPAYAALRMPQTLHRPVETAAIALARRFHAPAHHTYVATPSMTALLRGWGFAGRLKPLSRGVDCGMFRPAPDHAPRPPVLLYVGRVAPEKNIEAFLKLTKDQIGAAQKVVVGDGPSLTKLRRAYPETEFRGALTGMALADAYRAADVFVFPSKTDTFGIVLIEAMASGLPIAAHDVPGPRDIVTAPMLGALDADLGQAIVRALNAPGSRAARHTIARDTYSWEKVATAFAHSSAELRT